jgi:hypothetical protein
MAVGDELASSWGDEVPVLGHAAGYVVGTVPAAAGLVGSAFTSVLQFLTPKTEQEHFISAMTLGTGVGASRLAGAGEGLVARVRSRLASSGERLLARVASRLASSGEGPLARAASRLAASAESRLASRMRLDYQIWEGSKLIDSGTLWSGPGGDWGHAEIAFAERFMGKLGPQHDVLLNGAYNMCGHGQCRAMLNAMAIMDGPNIFYFGYSFESGPMLQPFISGRGFVYSWEP